MGLRRAVVLGLLVALFGAAPAAAAPSLTPFVSLTPRRRPSPARRWATTHRVFVVEKSGPGPAGDRRRAAADAVPEHHLERALVRERARAALHRVRRRLRRQRQVLRVLHVEPERRPRDLGVQALAREPERRRRRPRAGVSSRSRTRAVQPQRRPAPVARRVPLARDRRRRRRRRHVQQRPEPGARCSASCCGSTRPARPSTVAAIGLRNPWRFSFDRAAAATS